MKKIYKILAAAGLICLAAGTVATSLSIALDSSFRREVVRQVEESSLAEGQGESRTGEIFAETNC